ncbi:ADP-ribosylation factor-like protein 16 [Physella acuta]|uniref:ADP-ribosylation factor-like protein 16 n=1 Tax=Physella acuta TaxID=109671 RepID=UPI0027DDC100|nr:ADP-ribosylation factor-like protein 16 [Physella acuta]
MILLIGAPSVGKTLLLKRLQNTNPTTLKDDVPATIPTVGTNLMTVNAMKKVEVTVREVGGAMGPIWQNYFKDSHSLMFMLDISKHTQVAISCVQLMTILADPALQNIPVLLILNKMDIPGGISHSELDSLVRLSDLVRHASQKITVLETSAKNGNNLDKVAKWIYEQNKLDEAVIT